MFQSNISLKVSCSFISKNNKFCHKTNVIKATGLNRKQEQLIIRITMITLHYDSKRIEAGYCIWYGV